MVLRAHIGVALAEGDVQIKAGARVVGALRQGGGDNREMVEAQHGVRSGGGC